MDTMGKSMQGMNLENVMRELRAITGKGNIPAPQAGYGATSTPLKILELNSGNPMGPQLITRNQKFMASFPNI